MLFSLEVGILYLAVILNLIVFVVILLFTKPDLKMYYKSVRVLHLLALEGIALAATTQIVYIVIAIMLDKFLSPSGRWVNYCLLYALMKIRFLFIIFIFDRFYATLFLKKYEQSQRFYYNFVIIAFEVSLVF